MSKANASESHKVGNVTFNPAEADDRESEKNQKQCAMACGAAKARRLAMVDMLSRASNLRLENFSLATQKKHPSYSHPTVHTPRLNFEHTTHHPLAYTMALHTNTRVVVALLGSADAVSYQ